ncbi:hypothetical protein B0T16DRAFT_29565 [Cercophora newfieldiana]|uniref:Uncharacterized protein n=1 Tax=Cercophora newfieldiana TaxID=92897 RepID=A0AA39YP51_9PEZI|nr:hypothetical protein B0T16DRAFT_29565 [Cercophora newfieldiana]
MAGYLKHVASSLACRFPGRQQITTKGKLHGQKVCCCCKHMSTLGPWRGLGPTCARSLSLTTQTSPSAGVEACVRWAGRAIFGCGWYTTTDRALLAVLRGLQGGKCVHGRYVSDCRCAQVLDRRGSICPRAILTLHYLLAYMQKQGRCGQESSKLRPDGLKHVGGQCGASAPFVRLALREQAGNKQADMLFTDKRRASTLHRHPHRYQSRCRVRPAGR